MAGHGNHGATKVAPARNDIGIWTKINAAWDGKCPLCKVGYDEGDDIYHNPEQTRGWKVRCVDCHESMPGWEMDTALPEPDLPAVETTPETSIALSGLMKQVYAEVLRSVGGDLKKAIDEAIEKRIAAL